MRPAAGRSSNHADRGSRRPPLERAEYSGMVLGTVRLTAGDIVYIPAPTSDPRDPLNMSPWQKFAVSALLSIFATLGLSLVSGFGGLLGFYAPEYMAQGKGTSDITRLLTYPTLFMGIGNLIGTPLAIAVGRRVVILVSTLFLALSATLCAWAPTYEAHLGARMLLGLAAGQAESIVPMIIQEIHFLHERSKALMVQQTIQVIATSVWVVCASPIAAALSPRWWYGLGSVLAVLEFVAVAVFLPETKYKRLEANQHDSSNQCPPNNIPEASEDEDTSLTLLLPKRRPSLDFERFDARTWSSDMRLFVGKPEWHEACTVLNQATEMLIFPNVLWAMCLGGFTLGVNILITSTYGAIISSPPYNWPETSISYITSGQILVVLLALPLLGSGADKLIQSRAARNGGIHEPETRLIPLILPITVGVLTSILYGVGASHPTAYHWSLYMWSMAAYFFTFLGANITSLTYLLDSYPGQAEALLLLICSFRGFLSFVVSNAAAASVQSRGYEATFLVLGIVTGVLGSIALPLYCFGKRLRRYTTRWTRRWRES